MNQKGFITLLLIIAGVLIALVLLGYYSVSDTSVDTDDVYLNQVN